MKLSKRLQAIADLVPRGSVVGDIGTDHGQLPCYLVRQGIAPRVIACDVNAQPLAGARRLIAEEGLTESIELRLGDGLSVLAPQEVQTVTISGMGASLLTELLEAGGEVVASLAYMILQPNLAAHLVREWAMAHSWRIDAEDLVYEEGRYYEIVALRPGAAPALSPAQLWLGPALLQKRHPLLPQYVGSCWSAEQRVLQELQKSRSPEARNKYALLMEKWQIINEVMLCQYNAAIL